jgi:type VI secretion system protein ImpK
MSPPDIQEKAPKHPVEAPIGSENLALFYQGLLTGIVRVQARRQHIPEGEVFRRRTKAALQEVERDAIAAGYDGGDVRETHFAVVAFLDSVVLNSSDPIRAEWERQTLQEELFGQTDAGVVFFEKLERFRSRRDSDQLADILEVYLLCLLLGFEGRYSGRLRGELDSIVERLNMRIEDIRGRNNRISPNGALPVEAVSPATEPAQPANRWLLLTIGAVAVAVLCFLVLFIQLSWTSGQVRSALF